jgi:hypothetical protein
MLTELTTWFEVLRDGSTTAPRSRPRSHVTIRIRVRTVLPTLRGWSAAGHNSLREITRDHVRAALPDRGSPRALLGSSLRSLFQLLKARKVIFTNPDDATPDRQTRDAPTSPAESRCPPWSDQFHRPGPRYAAVLDHPDLAGLDR